MESRFCPSNGGTRSGSTTTSSPSWRVTAGKRSPNRRRRKRPAELRAGDADSPGFGEGASAREREVEKRRERVKARDQPGDTSESWRSFDFPDFPTSRSPDLCENGIGS